MSCTEGLNWSQSWGGRFIWRLGLHPRDLGRRKSGHHFPPLTVYKKPNTFTVLSISPQKYTRVSRPCHECCCCKTHKFAPMMSSKSSRPLLLWIFISGWDLNEGRNTSPVTARSPKLNYWKDSVDRFRIISAHIWITTSKYFFLTGITI